MPGGDGRVDEPTLLNASPAIRTDADSEIRRHAGWVAKSGDAVFTTAWVAPCRDHLRPPLQTAFRMAIGPKTFLFY